MQSEHVSLQWCCDAPIHGSMFFGDEEAYKMHLRQGHKGRFAESQLSFLAQLNVRPEAQIFTVCPICMELPEEVKEKHDNQMTSEAQEALQIHVAAHLESLALISVPWLDGPESCQSSERDSTQRESNSGHLIGSKPSFLDPPNLELPITNIYVDPEWGGVLPMTDDIGDDPAWKLLDEVIVISTWGQRAKEWSFNGALSLPYYSGHSKDKTLATFTQRYYNQILQEEDQDACLEALFLTNPRDDRLRIEYSIGKLDPGTCQWILQNETFKLWLEDDSQLLWLSGPPESGKTIMATYLAGELSRATKESKPFIVLEYYCSDQDGKRNTVLAILRGLIYLILEQYPGTIKYLLGTFKVEGSSLFNSENSFAVLWDIFTMMLSDPAIDTAYLVLDALDECEQNLAIDLLERFNGLSIVGDAESEGIRLKAILLTREYPEHIARTLQSSLRIKLTDNDKEQDSVMIR